MLLGTFATLFGFAMRLSAFNKSSHVWVDTAKPRRGSAMYLSTSSGSRESQSNSVRAGEKALLYSPKVRRWRTGLGLRLPTRARSIRATILPTAAMAGGLPFDADSAAATMSFGCSKSSCCRTKEPIECPSTMIGRPGWRLAISRLTPCASSTMRFQLSSSAMWPGGLPSGMLLPWPRWSCAYVLYPAAASASARRAYRDPYSAIPCNT